MDLSPRALAANLGGSLCEEVRLATKIPGKDSTGMVQWPHSVLFYQYGEFNLPVGVIDFLLAEPKECMSGKLLILWGTSSTPPQPVQCSPS